jgi:hypothetical protein
MCLLISFWFSKFYFFKVISDWQNSEGYQTKWLTHWFTIKYSGEVTLKKNRSHYQWCLSEVETFVFQQGQGSVITPLSISLIFTPSICIYFS